MQYGEILKSSWSITWRHKNLWWLGLFAGAGGGSYGASNSSNFNSGGFPGSTGSGSSPADAFYQVGDALATWWPVIAAAFVLLMMLWLVFAILQLAATGGLITQVDAAERGAAPKAATGWGDGFRRFWQLAVVSFFVALPALVVFLFIAIAAFALLALPLYQGGTPSLGAAIGLAVTFFGAIVILVPLGIVLGVIGTLARRSVMLEGQSAPRSFSTGWQLLKTRFKDVALMWLIMLGVGIGASIALFIVILLPVLAMVAAIIAAAVTESIALVVGLAVVLVTFVIAASMLFSALYGTFYSSVWTLFWRRLTGRQPDLAAAPPAPYYPAPAAGYASPGAPAGYPPVAPPMAPPTPPPAPAPPVAPSPPPGGEA